MRAWPAWLARLGFIADLLSAWGSTAWRWWGISRRPADTGTAQVDPTDVRELMLPALGVLLVALSDDVLTGRAFERPARNRPASRCTSSTSDSSSTPPSRGRICPVLSFHRCQSASRLPCSLMAGPRGADACWAASIRATWRTAALTGSRAWTRAESRRRAGIRRIRHQVIAYPATRVAYLDDPQVYIGGEPPVEL